MEYLWTPKLCSRAGTGSLGHRVTGSITTGSGRVGFWVNSFDPVPALLCSTLLSTSGLPPRVVLVKIGLEIQAFEH